MPAPPTAGALATLVGCLALGAGCGGSGEAGPAPPPAPPPPAVTPLPGFQTPLETGVTYTSVEFRPAVRLTVPADGEWTTEVGDTPEHFSILTERDFGQAILALHRITRVYDAERGGLEPGDTVPLTAGFADWLASHPHLDTSAPQPVDLLGQRAVQLDFTTLSSPPRTPDQFCGHAGDNCVPLFYDGLDTIAYGAQVRGRFIVVPLDGGGELVVEQFVSSAAAFDRGLAVLRPLLDSIELAE